jgi:hypothetical protein
VSFFCRLRFPLVTRYLRADLSYLSHSQSTLLLQLSLCEQHPLPQLPTFRYPNRKSLLLLLSLPTLTNPNLPSMTKLQTHPCPPPQGLPNQQSISFLSEKLKSSVEHYSKVNSIWLPIITSDEIIRRLRRMVAKGDGVSTDRVSEVVRTRRRSMLFCTTVEKER